MFPPPRTLLITGASSGIGEALARHYAARGVRLALTGRDGGRLAAVAKVCRGRGAVVETASIDVTDRAGLRAWIERVDAAKPIDLAIANAGISAGMGATETEERSRQVFAVNIEGVLNTAYPLIARMTARRAGQIALMSSLAAFRGLPTSPSYSASKAAVKALAEAWRVSLKPQGIRVSVICPGFVATPLTARNKFHMPFLMPAERAAEIIARGLAQDRPRIAFPFPMAAATWFLATLPPRLSDRLVGRAPGKRD